jgi:predicted DNA-binding protein
VGCPVCIGVYDGRMDLKRTNIHLTLEQLKKLSAESKLTGVPKAEIIRRLINAHYAKKEKR